MPLSLERYSVTLGKTWSLVFRKLRVEYANKPLVFPKLGEISLPPPPPLTVPFWQHQKRHFP